MPDDDNFRVVDNMKYLDQSRKDVQGRMITTTQNTGICFATPKESRYIECWNVRAIQKTKLDGLKSTGEEQLKQKETAWDGHHGIKQDKSQKTGRSGDAALKPYAPTDTKKKGEDERN